MSFQNELDKILAEIKRQNIKMKLYGSVGIKLMDQSHARQTFDIDFFALSKDERRIIELFSSLEYRISKAKRRTDLVFFKKEPIKIKIDIELYNFKVLDRNIRLDFAEYIESEGFVLPTHLLLITKLFAPLDEDNTYDLAHLLSEGVFEIEELVRWLNDPSLNLQILKEKISELPELINKNKKIENSIKFKAIKFLKQIKRILNL